MNGGIRGESRMPRSGSSSVLPRPNCQSGSEMGRRRHREAANFCYVARPVGSASDHHMPGAYRRPTISQSVICLAITCLEASVLQLAV